MDLGSTGELRSSSWTRVIWTKSSSAQHRSLETNSWIETTGMGPPSSTEYCSEKGCSPQIGAGECRSVSKVGVFCYNLWPLTVLFRISVIAFAGKDFVSMLRRVDLDFAEFAVPVLIVGIVAKAVLVMQFFRDLVESKF